MDSVDPGKLWKIIKNIKIETSVDINSISSAVAAIENKMNIESSYLVFDNMTENNLKIAAEMYFYLVTSREKSSSWIIFYTNLIQTENVSQILLSLNRLMKGTKPMDDKFKIIANKVFKRVTSLQSLKYEGIDQLFAGRNLLKSEGLFFK